VYIAADGKLFVDKSYIPVPEENGDIIVSPIINTTYWFDSHKDVHIDGLWNNTHNRKPSVLLNREHKGYMFDYIISDEFEVDLKMMSWKDLGLPYEGVTQALMFKNAVIKQDRNPYMYTQYKNGWVKNHSVEMRYINLDLAINDADYKEEYAEWKKHIEKIANKEEVMEDGYFWAIKEAVYSGGAAVPQGSNSATPTHGPLKEIIPIEPELTTQKEPKAVNWQKVLTVLR
jgi:hypothetical protein